MSSSLSTPVHAPSFPLRTPLHSSPTKLDPLSSPSLYVTFKVLQLVNSFRKRVQTRVNCGETLKKRATTTRRTPDFCQDFERQAFAEIDQYLGRKSKIHTRKRQDPADWDNTLALGQAKRETIATVAESHPAKSLQWLLDELDQSVKSDNRPLITVAKHHELFVTRRNDFSIERLSLKEVIHQLVTVRDLLSTLRRATSIRSHVKTLAEGNELLDLALDESQTANLEHLLLCLRDQLLRLLVSKLVTLVRKDLVECQRDRHRHCEEWFCEFPDARHPLSTTWPWSIKPSLAVLWGVCWMFYDHNRADETNNWFFDSENFTLTEADIQSMLQSAQPAQQPFPGHPGPADFRHLTRGPSDPRLPRAMQASNSPAPPAVTQPRLYQQHQHQQQQQHRGLGVASSHPQHTLASYYTLAPDLQAAHASEGLAESSTNIGYATAPPSSYAAAAHSGYHWATSLPEEIFAANPLPFDQANTQAAADDVGQWNTSLAPHPGFHINAGASWSCPPPALPPQHTRPSDPPQIRVITDPEAYPALQQPQDLYQSTASLSSASSLPNQDVFSNHNYSPAHLSPRNPFMNPPDQKMQRTPPHSPHPNSPHMAAVMSDQLSRKRSHEQMVDATSVPVEQNHTHSRTGSVSSHHLEGSAGEGFSSPKIITTIKRGNPPQNEQGKYICDHGPDCSEHVFERKCEWSKHMDKHDRPYRCGHAECAKLQGFTYSGGLLRHEREVHNKHGGPKAQLMCPHYDCKRHSGKGFTRRENLNEHLRRVHRGKDPQSQGISQRDTNNALVQSAEEAETPYYTQPPEEDVDSPMHKRRRLSERSVSEGGEESIRDEVVHLRSENEELRGEIARKDVVIAKLQQDLQAAQAMVLVHQTSADSSAAPV